MTNPNIVALFENVLLTAITYSSGSLTRGNLP